LGTSYKSHEDLKSAPGKPPVLKSDRAKISNNITRYQGKLKRKGGRQQKSKDQVVET